MTFMHVNSKTVNLRSEPLVKPETLIAPLHFGQAVEVLGPTTREGWLSVRAIAAKSQTGVISGSFLRTPLSDVKEALLAAAAVEWERFGRGAGKEDQAPYSAFVGKMWKAIGMKLTGKDTGVPWSAACISFIARNAGYKQFTFAAAHAVYIHEAVVAREAKKPGVSGVSGWVSTSR